jgi:glycosyltransferase involved in cell wall biosynthesis
MADHVFYLTEDMAERWAEIAPSAKRACSVTYSIVDPAIYAAAPPWSGDGPPVVLISGLVCAKKGQLEFIRQVSPKLAVEGIETWLAGDFDPARNSYMAACAAAAAPLGDSVQFLGYRSDVAALMRRATVIAVASRYEGLVRAMIEAMSCARPVVSFDVCSAHEMLERESEGAGAVVEAGDFPGMAAAIIDYCRDPVRAASAGEKGRLTATRLFGRDSVVERYERVYDMLAAGTAAPAPA